MTTLRVSHSQYLIPTTVIRGDPLIPLLNNDLKLKRLAQIVNKMQSNPFETKLNINMNNIDLSSK